MTKFLKTRGYTGWSNVVWSVCIQTIEQVRQQVDEQTRQLVNSCVDTREQAGVQILVESKAVQT